MSDMLVKLYAIDYKFDTDLPSQKITIKKASIIDKDSILEFVRSNFESGRTWAHECEYALFNNPTTCYIAVQNKEIIGFSCYDSTAKGFFGPMGVKASHRKKGIGQELLLRSLFSMKESGYAYAIIGWSSTEAIKFYKDTVNAIEIEDSPPNKSVYKNCISQE